MAVAAAMMIGSAAMAQNNDSTKVKRTDKAEMVKKRTEMLSRQYGLNEEQTQKLLELNTKYADSLRTGMQPRGDRRMNALRRTGGGNMRAMPDSTGNRIKKVQGDRRMPSGQNRQKMAETRNNYNLQLKAIMTEEQYQKYSEDLKKQPARGGAHGNNKRQVNR